MSHPHSHTPQSERVTIICDQQFPNLPHLRMSTANYTSSLELENRTSHSVDQSAHSNFDRPPHGIQREISQDVGVVEQYLQPADRGPAAWRLLGVAFIFEALLWGKVLLPALFTLESYVKILRVSAFFRSISKLLLPSSAICQQPVCVHCRNCGLWDIIPRRTACYSYHQTLF